MKRVSSPIVAVYLLSSSLGASGIETDKLRPLQEFSDAFAALAAEVKPAVVAIETEREISARNNPYVGTPFEDFFGRHPFFRMPREPRKGIQEGLGSGVIASNEGFILTNNHVITIGANSVADRITVHLVDKRSFEAEVVGRDPLTDLAVLKIDADELTAIPFGDSDQLSVGELVVAVGSPFGQLHTVTTGVVSALGRGHVRLAEYEEYIQTDAAINPGNSGGALIDTRGQLVGINTAIASRSGGYDGIGFAIPINLVSNVMEQLIEHGQVRRGLLGVRIQEVDDALAKTMGLDKPRGVLIGDVSEDSAAEKAGLKVGDIVLDVDGAKTNSTAELRNKIAHSPPGTGVKLRVWRDGKERKVKATLTALDEGELAAEEPQRQSEQLGLRVQELTAELADKLGYEDERGVIVAQVESGSRAARAKLHRGDLIIEVNRRQIESVSDYEDALAESEGTVLMLVLDARQKFTRFVTLKLPKR